MHLWSLPVSKILYVTDLDGTLLQPDVTISDESAAILQRLLDAGLPLTAATARTSFSVMPILRGLPFRLPLILQNGAVVDACYIFLRWVGKHHCLMICEPAQAEYVQSYDHTRVYRDH